jgi:hypothetical protein
VGDEGNAVLMGYVGDEETPASHLREADLDGGENRPLFDLLIDNIRLFLACNVIHGDLSLTISSTGRGRSPSSTSPRPLIRAPARSL